MNISLKTDINFDDNGDMVILSTIKIPKKVIITSSKEEQQQLSLKINKRKFEEISSYKNSSDDIDENESTDDIF